MELEHLRNTTRSTSYISDDDVTVPTANYVLESSPIISDTSMYYINICLDIVLRGSIGIFGLFSNIINMIIFQELGLKDSMSVGLMALSFTDFVINVLGTAGTSCIIWRIFFPGTTVDPVSFAYVVFWWMADCISLCSYWITTLLSIERCVCVVFPFKVKQIFTRLRCLFIIIVIYIVSPAVYLPVFVSMRLGWTKIEMETVNGTVTLDRMVVFHSDNWDVIITYIDIAAGAVIPYPSQFVVLICVVWMTLGLRLSSRVRMTNEAEDGKKSRLSTKEGKLVKVVLFLAIIFTVCNVPRILASYAKYILSGVTLDGEHGNVYYFMWNLAHLAGSTNSSVNIFVYLIVNTNYRMKFKQMFANKK